MSAGPFKIGDVVVCVDARPTLRTTCPLIKGKLYRVECLSARTNSPILSGVKAAWEHDGFGWSPNRFRHIPKADDTFIEQMRSLRPIKEDVPDLLSSEYRPWLNSEEEKLRRKLNVGGLA